MQLNPREPSGLQFPPFKHGFPKQLFSIHEKGIKQSQTNKKISRSYLIRNEFHSSLLDMCTEMQCLRHWLRSWKHSYKYHRLDTGFCCMQVAFLRKQKFQVDVKREAADQALTSARFARVWTIVSLGSVRAIHFSAIVHHVNTSG